MTTFGQRLKTARLRVKPHMTQDTLGQLLRKDSLTVSKWERDQHLPSARADYDELAYHVNCSVVWLREGIGEPGDHYQPDPDASDSEKRRAVRRTPRARIVTGRQSFGGSAEIVDTNHDWSLVALCAHTLLKADPNISLTALSRALPVLYAMAQRAPNAVDVQLAAQIVGSVQQ